MAKKEKPVKEPKQKKEAKTKAEKVSMMDKFRKKSSGEDDGLDIITEAKEPFSLSGFFETHVVERAKRMKNTLQERGILFFLFSPFQARGRLIAQMLILCIGIMFGVVPRASSLVSALQDQAYASEIAGLKQKTVGSITLTPTASSNYKKMHMIAFLVEGKNLPSDASKYDVHLAKSYGASDWEDVTYSWTMYPVTDTQRIMLVAIDQSKQASGYGAFDLLIKLSDEELKDFERDSAPFEVTLSTAQETTDLYNKSGIHLSALTEAVCGKGKIADKQKDFDAALEKYQVALEQAEAMPVSIKVEPTKDKLEAFCLSKRVYRTIDDYSTTEDIMDVEKVDELPTIEYGVVLTSNGIEYDDDFVSTLGSSDEDVIIANAFENVDQAKDSVITAMVGVNNAADAWYNTLTGYKLILNQTIKFNTFPLYARCTNTVDDPLDFIDGEMADPGDNPQGGLSSTVTDPPQTQPQPSTEEPIEEPTTTEPIEEPTTTEPVEEPVEEPVDEESSEEPSTEEPVVEESSEESSEIIPETPGTSGKLPVSTDPADSK